MLGKENKLILDKHILICSGDKFLNLDMLYLKEFEYIKNNFCGNVLLNLDNLNEYNNQSNIIIYICGNIEQILEQMQLFSNKKVNVIKELSYNFGDSENYKIINIGQVPINIHNVGLYFKKFFNSNQDYFDLISNEHQFQTLTDSNKASNAFRTGIYLSKVEEDIDDEIKFNLLRCSSNLSGPTDNLRSTDNNIITQVNDIAEDYFEEKTELNHVLAQIYENKLEAGTEKKAKIKEHSDKTKDMPENGLMAFCTFYKKNNDKFISKDDMHDYCYNNTTVLTKIRFKLKKTVIDNNLTDKFDIILYPNSVFIMSLSTNRLYTHEIVPSQLSVNMLPIRLGYVIRCSKTNAIFKNNQTHIVDKNNYIKLEEATENDIKILKNLYYKENMTDEIIKYENINFSLNKGDYCKPNI